MARTTGPLFSLDASGSIAKTIVYSKWKGRSYVRRHAIPSNPQTGLQTGMRSVLKFITQAYGLLSDGIKLQWSDAALVDNITPLNAQVRDAGARARLNLGWREELNAMALTTIDPPTAPSIVYTNGSFTVSWTRPAMNQGDYSTVVLVDTVDPTPYDISQVRVIVPVASTSAVILGLDASLVQICRVAETSAFGEIGTLSASDTYTP